MKKSIIISLLLLVMAGCNQELSNKETEIFDEEKINKEMEQTNFSTLSEELLIHELKINDSSDKILEILGEPISGEAIRETETSIFSEMVYEQSYFLIKDNVIAGYAILNNPNLKTKAGVGVGDSISTLFDAYSDDKILKMADTYYLYDESFILTFEADADSINQIAFFDMDAYLTMSDWTVEDLLLQSELVTKESMNEIEVAVPEMKDGNEENEQEVTANIEESENLKELSQEHDWLEAEEETAVHTDVVVFDTYEKRQQLAEFTHSVEIGDDESIIRNFLGQGERNWEDNRFTTYGPFPAKFVTQNGKVKLISWGRVGLYDNWKNDEGVTSYSTYEEISEAYADYEHKLLYRQNDEYPSYIRVEYHDNLLVFTLYEGIISTLFLCSPEMIETDMVKNTSFTFDRLEENPF